MTPYRLESEPIFLQAYLSLLKKGWRKQINFKGNNHHCKTYQQLSRKQSVCG